MSVDADISSSLGKRHLHNVFEQIESRRYLTEANFEFVKSYSNEDNIVLPCDDGEWAELTTLLKNLAKHALIQRSDAYKEWRKRQPDILAYATYLPPNLTVVRDTFASNASYSLDDLPLTTFPTGIYDSQFVINTDAYYNHVRFHQICTVDFSNLMETLVERMHYIDSLSVEFKPKLLLRDFFMVDWLFEVPEDLKQQPITFKIEPNQFPEIATLEDVGTKFARNIDTLEPLSEKEQCLVCPYAKERFQQQKENRQSYLSHRIKEERKLAERLKQQKLERRAQGDLSYLALVKDPLEVDEEDLLDEAGLEAWIVTYCLQNDAFDESQRPALIEEYKRRYSPIFGPKARNIRILRKRTIDMVEKYMPKKGVALLEEELAAVQLAEALEQQEKEAAANADPNAKPKKSKKRKKKEDFEDEAWLRELAFQSMQDLADNTTAQRVLDDLLFEILQPNPAFERISIEALCLAQQGEALGLFVVAMTYLLQVDLHSDEQTLKTNYDKALLFLELAAANREPFSACFLGWLSEKDMYRSFDDITLNTTSFTYAIRAANAGLDVAQLMLAYKSYEDRTCPNKLLADQYLYLAARQCHPLALRDSCRLSNMGRFGYADYALSAFLLTLYTMYLPNDVTIYVPFAEMFMYGYGMRRRMSFAIKAFERIASKSTEACYWVGSAYSEGRYVKQDYAKARYYLEFPAAKNFYDSNMLFGVLCERGKGGPPDYIKAEQAYLSALKAKREITYGDHYVITKLRRCIAEGKPFEALNACDECLVIVGHEKQEHFLRLKRRVQAYIEKHVQNTPLRQRAAEIRAAVQPYRNDDRWLIKLDRTGGISWIS